MMLPTLLLGEFPTSLLSRPLSFLSPATKIKTKPKIKKEEESSLEKNKLAFIVVLKDKIYL